MTANELESIVSKWDEQLTNSVKKINEYVQQSSKLNDDKVFGYFTSSLNMTYREDDENVVIGSFHIKNNTINSLDHLSICLMIKATVPYQFSGKYVTSASAKQKNPTPFKWKQFETEDQEEGVYWFSMLPDQTIDSLNQISFPDFIISWEPEVPCSCQVSAFIYPDPNKAGIPALNAINMAVTN